MFAKSTAAMQVRRNWKKFLWPATLLMLVAVLLLMPASVNPAHAVAINDGKADLSSSQSAKTVPVTLFVMSQCPDAKFCQKAFKPVVEALPSVMTLQTEYIASLQQDGAVQCMHGQAECTGNKQQLCLQHYLPSENRKYVQALLCHSSGVVSDVQHLQTCMTEANVSPSTQADVLKCIDGTLGASLQAESAKRVEANSVKRSCTVFVDGVKRCIRDGGTWYDCPGGSDTFSFVKTICDAYTAKSGKAAAECKAAMGQATVAAQSNAA